MSEISRLARLRRLFARAALPQGVAVGIGDDAAVLAPGGDSWVWTVDSAVEGVHFRRDWLSLEDVGFRSLMAAVSDLAAMGAAPRGVLSALILPADFTDADLDRLAAGQALAAALAGTAVIGGNLARGRELSITTTALGEAARPLLRSAARDGDTVAVAGGIGLAAAGLEALRRGADGDELAAALDAFRRPRAQIDAGLVAAVEARGAIDLSDGLALDAARLSAESGVSIVLDAVRLLYAAGSPLLRAAASLSVDPLELVLYGGEDYALLATFPEGFVPSPFVAIGVCASGRGVILESANGTRRELKPRGFDHFGG